MSVGWGQFDITPPELTNFEFTSSDTVDVTDSTQTISYTMTVIDDMSGVYFCSGSYYSPTWVDYLDFSSWFPSEGELEVTNEGEINIPQFIEPGLYTLNGMSCYDYSSNDMWYNSEDLDSLEFSTEIFVINNPYICDILGDVNDDLILNVQDIVLIINLILDGEYDECGDINSDGELNVLDVVTVVNIILSGP